MARIWADCAYEVLRIWNWRRLVKPMQNTRSRKPSVVLTSQCASIRDCHLRTSERSLSVVKDMPQKLVRQFLPWTSSTRRRILRKASSSLLLRSPRETSNTRPLSPSEAILVPAVLVTRVLPTAVLVKRAGAFTSYQSFLPLVRRLFLPTAILNDLCCWIPC